MKRAERAVREILSVADIKINGDRDFDIQINRPEFYERFFADGVIGFGETYMESWWDCEALDVMIDRVLRADLEHAISPYKMLIPFFVSKIINLQRRSRAFKIGEFHYDMGNDLYQIMLDKRMTYTCGYWKDADDLESAQEAKLDLVCRKMGLRPGMRVLDIGCGWGSFAAFAAEKYGVRVTGVTVSREQIELGQQKCQGLDVELRLQDYRDVDEQFDRIISLGMFEHVGRKNYATYMKKVRDCLVDDGLFLLHTIGTDTPKTSVDPWTDKYIFPGGMLPTLKQMTAASEGILVMEDLHNFGTDYDPTLMAWMANVDAHKKELQQLGYDEPFYRMWRFFLLGAAGGFRSHRNHLWQIVYSKKGVDGGYQSIR
ncbi:MAG TPA: cyclopropane fatty acyl phospholipid synthase [Gammaproteobacteria bacterium]|nr:cyclopropane fatty acyl phospholipid synthase [Gammaproteobacteria bacterium]